MLTAAPKLLSVREVAAYLGVHRKTVYDLIKNGELDAFQPRGRGHSLFIEQETVDEWLRGGESPNTEIAPIRPCSRFSEERVQTTPRSAA